jgi:hypothetical protein
MICPGCATAMTEDGEWPFTDQKTSMTFQVHRFTCPHCGIYLMQEIKPMWTVTDVLPDGRVRIK